MNNSHRPIIVGEFPHKAEPEFNVVSQVSGGGDYRVIFAWRTGSNMITIRADIAHRRGEARHYGLEQARQIWRSNKAKDFKQENDPLDWDLIHDILPLH